MKQVIAVGNEQYASSSEAPLQVRDVGLEEDNLYLNQYLNKHFM